MTAMPNPRARERAPRPKLLTPKKPPLAAPAAGLAVPRHVAAAQAGVPIRQALSSGHAIRVKKDMCSAVVDYDRPGTADDADPFAEADFLLGKRIYRALQHWYPDQRWMVRVTHAGGIIAISLPVLMKRNLYQIVHIPSLAADPGMRSIMRAAGECLERLGLPRAGFHLDRFLEARAKGPYGRKPPSRLILPDFSTSARPRVPIEPLPAGALQ